MRGSCFSVPGRVSCLSAFFLLCQWVNEERLGLLISVDRIPRSSLRGSSLFDENGKDIDENQETNSAV